MLSKKTQTKMANNSSRKSMLLALLTLIWYLLLRRKITRLLLRCTLRQNFMFSSSKYAIETSKSILYFGHQYSKCNEKKKSFQNWIFEHLIEVCHIVCWHQSFEKALAQMLRHRHQGSKDYLALSRGRWAGLSNEYIFGEGKTESDQWDEFLITLTLTTYEPVS